LSLIRTKYGKYKKSKLQLYLGIKLIQGIITVKNTYSSKKGGNRGKKIKKGGNQQIKSYNHAKAT
jgi:hypothetical protein